jgi:hypothetical protein
MSDLPSFLLHSIKDEEGIKAFFRWLAVDQRCSFHPDDSLSDLVGPDGSPALPARELGFAQVRMEECWDLVESDVVSLDRMYQIGIDALAAAMEAGK